MEDYYEYLDSNGVTTLYKLIKDDTVALIDGYSVTINGITTTLDTHMNDTDIHTPIATIENMVDTKISGLVNSAPETLDTLKELSDALGNDPNFATTVANQIGTKADKDSVYIKQETDTLLEGKANSVHNHVVSDITDFPTIPTKLSQLENDMGFGSGSGGVITSVSWSDITDKPNFSTVATSGSYNDLSNTPTIPTKVSQLENDIGFVSGLTDVVDTKSNQTIDGNKSFSKPISRKADITTSTVEEIYRFTDTNATPCGSIYNRMHWYNNNVHNRHQAYNATSGKDMYFEVLSHTDGSGVVNTGGSVTNNKNLTTVTNATGNTYVATMGWVNNPATSTNVVHRSGDETIAGTKTFTSTPFVSGGGTTTGIYLKNTAIARNEVPTQFYHATFRAHDKNDKILGEYCVEKSTTGCTLLNMNVRSEDSNGKQLYESLCLNMSNDGSAVRFYPSSNNKMDLGMANNKWANAYIDRVVCTRFTHSVNNGSVYITGGSEYDKGATLVLHGEESSDAGTFIINSRDKTRSLYLVGKPDGTLQWAGQNIALDGNLVHRTGNEAIQGVKYFDNLVYLHNNISNKNSQMDLFTTPTNTLFSHYMFVDKNDEVSAYMQYGQQNTGTDFIGLFVKDKSENLIGVELTTNKEFVPLGNNSYSLGASNNKWANVYATTFNGNLKGNADTSTKSSYLDNYSAPNMNKIYLDWDQQVKGYVGLKVDNTVMGGLITTKNIGSQAANSATYATTQATSDNSTKIATTAWVRTYVNSVAGSGSVGASISAYYSNATTLTAEGSSSSSSTGPYPADYSNYIDIAPTVGTIYTGSQLFSSFTPNASGSIFRPPIGSGGNAPYQTTAKATATFSGAFSSSAKYLCTTANAVKFRAYVSSGTTSNIGTASVVDQSSAKSIFIRVQ